MPATTPAPVRQRLVCYLSGFDPQGPAHYHQLYAREAAKQAQVTGDAFSVGQRRRLSEHVSSWSVHATVQGQAVETRYDFLRWDDIVRGHWPRSRWGLLKATAFASWQMWRNGVMWFSWRRSWPMFAAIAAPGALMLAVALAALGLLGLATHLVLGGQPVWALLGLGVGGPLLAWGARVAEARTHMAWLMRSLACLVRQGRGQTPELDERLQAFGQALAAHCLSGTFDEVLLVGHSSGAMMAQLVAAEALAILAAAPPPDDPGAPAPRLSLLTLGHCSPLLSAQPEAHAYREALSRLLHSPCLDWVDLSAPPDGCCFALVDPTEPCIAGAGARRPKLVNPRFAQQFTPASYQALRSDKFRCHFQYVMAGEQAAPYDYFALTAGPLRLADYFAAQPAVLSFRQFCCFGGPALP